MGYQCISAPVGYELIRNVCTQTFYSIKDKSNAVFWTWIALHNRLHSSLRISHFGTISVCGKSLETT